MRILYVIDSLVPGGAERSLTTMLDPLRLRGVEPIVAHLSPAPGLQLEIDALGVERVAIAPAGRREAVNRLRELIADRRPALVHTTLFESDLAGRVAGSLTHTPVVCTLANVAYGPEQAGDARVSLPRMRAAQAADAATARVVRRFHAVSQVVADTMARRLALPRHKLEVVVRGRDSDALGRRTPDRRRTARRAIGISHDQLLVLAIGRHEYQKGFDVLIEAMTRLDRPPTLIIAGREGNETNRLRSMAARLPPRTVRLLGARNDVADLCCAADLAVFPSRWEGLPGAVIEAMALELPIVASDIPQHREVLGERIALAMMPVDDVEGLATTLRAALAEVANGAVGAVAEGRARFESTYTVDRVATAMVGLYGRALGDHRAR